MVGLRLGKSAVITLVVVILAAVAAAFYQNRRFEASRRVQRASEVANKAAGVSKNRGPTRSDCIVRLRRVYRASSQLVETALHRSPTELCGAEADFGLAGVRVLAEQSPSELAILRQHKSWAVDAFALGFSPSEAVILTSTCSRVALDPDVGAFTSLDADERRKRLRDLIALPELSRIVAFGSRSCIEHKADRALPFYFWLDEQLAAEIRTICSLPPQSRQVLALAFPEVGERVVTLAKHAEALIKVIPSRYERELISSAAAALLPCMPVSAETMRWVSALDQLDVGTIASSHACDIPVHHNQIYRRLKEIAVKTKIDAEEKADEQAARSAATQEHDEKLPVHAEERLATYLRALENVMQTASPDERVLVLKTAAEFPLHAIGLFLDPRLTTDLRKRLFAQLKTHEPAKTVVIVSVLSQTDPPPPSGKGNDVVRKCPLAEAITTIESRGSVFLNAFNVDREGNISASFTAAFKDAIPGHTIYRLVQEGKVPAASDYVWLAVDVASGLAALVSLGASSAVSAAAKAGKVGKIVLLFSRLCQRLARAVHSIVKRMILSGPALRGIYAARRMRPFTAMIRNPAFVIPACLGTTYAGSQLVGGTIDGSAKNVFAQHLAGVPGGLLCWRFLRTTGSVAKAVSHPGIIVRVASAVGAKISAIRIFRFNGKAAVDAFMQWFRNTCLGKKAYKSFMKESVDDVIREAATLGGVVVLTRHMVAPSAAAK